MTLRQVSGAPVPLEVDSETGGWSSGGQAMMLIPRRFWVFVQMEAERMFGIPAAQQLYDAATRRGARVWCKVEAETIAISGSAVFSHYLDRVSRRGMGQFSVDFLSVKSRRASVSLAHSIFVSEYGPNTGRCVCYSFAAALAGGMEYLLEEAGIAVEGIRAEEVECRSNGGATCRFEVTPTDHGT